MKKYIVVIFVSLFCWLSLANAQLKFNNNLLDLSSLSSTITFSSDGQTVGGVEYDSWAFHFDQTTINPDTVWLGLWNDFGVTVTVDSTKITSDTDDQDFEYYYRPFGGGGTTIIDQLTGSTNYVGYYGITDASPTQASIPSNAQIGFLKPTVADDNIGVAIHFHYIKQER